MSEYNPEKVKERNGSASSGDNSDTTAAATHVQSQNTMANHGFRSDANNIYFDNTAIAKQDFVAAFKDLNLAPEPVPNSKKYGDPIPAGLAAFACSCISMGLVDMQARGVTQANALLGAFLTTSGLVCFVTGVLAYVSGNTWGSCTFMMFGGFWSSYSFLLMDIGGISSAYNTTSQYNNAVAFVFLPWIFFSFILWVCTWKSTWPLFLLLLFVWVFILLLTAALFTGSVGCTKAGGFFAILSGVLGLYNCLAGLVDTTNSYFVCKPIMMPQPALPDV